MSKKHDLSSSTKSCSPVASPVAVDELTLWHGAQLAVDTTLASPLRRDGSAMFRATDHDGAVLVEARRWKERTFPELSGGVAGGARILPPYLQWLAPKLRLALLSCRTGSMVLTFADGVQFSHALRPVRSQHPCWTGAPWPVGAGTRLWCTRWCVTTALGSGVKGGHLFSLSAVSSFRLKIIAPMWKTLMKFVDLGEPTSFLDHVYLGCTQRESKRNEIVVQE